MTMHATRDGQSITVNGNIGTEVHVKDGRVNFVRITEDAQHVRFFWNELGKLLDAADEEREVAHAERHGHTTTGHGHPHST